MDFGLKNKVAAVAASSSGLGHAVAVELAREGARLAICSRDEERIATAVDAVRKSVIESASIQPAVHGMAVDLSADDGPASFVEEAIARLGRVDVLVANNGGPPPGPPVGLSDADWQAGFRGTFLSSKRLAEAALPGMRERRWGRIIFVTSVSVKQPVEGLAVSTAMRSAVVGYAKMLSDELAAEGITINCVAPGSTMTGRLRSLLERRAEAAGVSVEEVQKSMEAEIPARRIGRPEEFAAAVAFLASERASYITGTVLAVDGGLVRSLT